MPTGPRQFNGLQLYEMAAYLTTQITPNGTANGNIQDTIWAIFYPGNTPLPYVNGQLDYSWLYSAEANYSSWATANAQNWYIAAFRARDVSGPCSEPVACAKKAWLSKISALIAMEIRENA